MTLTEMRERLLSVRSAGYEGVVKRDMTVSNVRMCATGNTIPRDRLH